MLDQDIVNLAKAIREHETGNRPVSGKTGELASRYQYMPSTWRSTAAKYLGDPNAPLTLENENKATYLKLSDWKNAGYNPGQIASMWNSGNPDMYAKGNRGVGQSSQNPNVTYNVPKYVNSVYQKYLKYKAETPAQPQEQQTGQLPPLQIPEQPKEEGFFTGLAKGALKPFAEIGVGLYNQAQNVNNLINGIGEKGKILDESAKTRNLPFLGETKPFMTGQEGFTEGAGKMFQYGGEIAPWFMGAGEVGAMGKTAGGAVTGTATGKGFLPLAARGAKMFGPSAAVQGFGSGLAEGQSIPSALFQGATSGAVGAVGGALGEGILGKGSELLGRVAGKGLEKTLPQFAEQRIKNLTPQLKQEASDYFSEALQPGKGIYNRLEGKGIKLGDVITNIAEEGLVPTTETLSGKLVRNTTEAYKEASARQGKAMEALNTILDEANRPIDLFEISNKAIENVRKSKFYNSDIKEAIIQEIKNSIEAEQRAVGNSIVTGRVPNEIKQTMWTTYDKVNNNKNIANKEIGFALKDAIEQAYHDIADVKELNKFYTYYDNIKKVLKSVNGTQVKGSAAKKAIGSVTSPFGYGLKIPGVAQAGDVVASKIDRWLTSPERLAGKGVKIMEKVGTKTGEQKAGGMLTSARQKQAMQKMQKLNEELAGGGQKMLPPGRTIQIPPKVSSTASETKQNALFKKLGEISKNERGFSTIGGKNEDLLVKEAKKYKSSKDFFKALDILYKDSWRGEKDKNADELIKTFNGRVFHGTNAAENIISKGYKKKEYFNSGVYFSDTPEEAINYMKQNRSSGKSQDVLVNDLSNLKIQQGKGEIVRHITKNYDGMEEYVANLKKRGFDGIKDEYGETLIWNVDKIKTPEKLTDIWKKSKKEKGATEIGGILPTTAVGLAGLSSYSNYKQYKNSQDNKSKETKKGILIKKLEERKSKLPVNEDKTKKATITVYNPEKGQTDATPHTGGFMTKMKFGDIALGNRDEYENARNKFKKGEDTFVVIPELKELKTPYGDGVFRVRDTMNKRYDGQNRVDVFMPKGDEKEKIVRKTPKASYYIK